ncbi:MAG: tyrosine-type recombinase/integrase [Kouleothrix sp.]|jgi:integrase|nr:tyrosine-type recombinase/integrase [Kouleothrix sp.]
MTELQRIEPPAPDAGALAPYQHPSMPSQHYAASASAPNTRRAYRADWTAFTAWCEQQGCAHLPAQPATVANYLAACADGDADHPPLAVATLERRLVAIARAHELAGHPSPSKDEWVRTVLKGIRRKRRAAQRRVAPIGVTVLRQALAALPETLLGMRDRALLLIGFCGALRRSELVGLDVSDLQVVPEGLILTLRRSKTDQEGEGILKGIPLGANAPTCPVRAAQAWLKAAGIKEGPLFRPIDRHGTVRSKRLNGSDIAVIVKRSVAAAGFDSDLYSGHSLRAGLATAAAGAGAPTYTIRRQTGHKTDRMLEIYIREGSLFRDNVVSLLGL